MPNISLHPKLCLKYEGFITHMTYPLNIPKMQKLFKRELVYVWQNSWEWGFCWLPCSHCIYSFCLHSDRLWKLSHNYPTHINVSIPFKNVFLMVGSIKQTKNKSRFNYKHIMYAIRTSTSEPMKVELFKYDSVLHFK